MCFQQNYKDVYNVKRHINCVAKISVSIVKHYRLEN